MKLIKKIIYWKLSLQFYLITFLRNKLYDFGLLKSYSFDIPIISVGNLTVGGTGKTPMDVSYTHLTLPTNREV